MSYRFQKTYTLLPQSPLIHFQSEQPGAALRATEVKPKLDKYIVKRYGQPLPDHWKNQQSPTALKYKLRFSVEGESELKKLGKKTDYEIYFANMNDNKESNREKEKGEPYEKIQNIYQHDADGDCRYISSGFFRRCREQIYLRRRER